MLRSDGRLCITVPSAHTERWFQWVDRSWLEMAGHVHVFTRAAMRSLLEERGFRVGEIRGRNVFYSLFWGVHTLVGTTHDGTGRIQDHFRLSHWMHRLWALLGEGRLKRGVERCGNALIPKSYVYYAECVADEPLSSQGVSPAARRSARRSHPSLHPSRARARR